MCKEEAKKLGFVIYVVHINERKRLQKVEKFKEEEEDFGWISCHSTP